MARSRIDREREIVNAGFALGSRASVEDIRARLEAPASDSTVRVLLGRLVRGRHEGVRPPYSVTMSPATSSRMALQQYLQTFFGGSLRLMLASLVRDGSWTDDDLEALRAEIDEARRQRRRS